MLSDKEIKEEIEKERLHITNFNDYDNLNPSSVDLTVGSSYKRPATQEVFSAEENNGQIILKPGSFYHLHTIQKVNLPPDLHGKTSSIMNQALSGIKVTTGVVDPGFNGRLILGAENAGETAQSISVGESIVKMTFTKLNSRPEYEYSEDETHIEKEGLDN